MKKLIALLLALTMIFAVMAGCTNNRDNKEDTNDDTASDIVLPASALEMLQKGWDAFPADQKFASMGGSYDAPVDNAPGAVTMGGEENPLWNLYVPDDQLANITEAATLVHAMNANTFTCGAVKLADGVDAAAFAQVMRDTILSTQWMCGFPERLIIAGVGNYVMIVFGLDGVEFPESGTVVTSFVGCVQQAYPDVEILFNETLL